MLLVISKLLTKCRQLAAGIKLRIQGVAAILHNCVTKRKINGAMGLKKERGSFVDSALIRGVDYMYLLNNLYAYPLECLKRTDNKLINRQSKPYSSSLTLVKVRNRRAMNLITLLIKNHTENFYPSFKNNLFIIRSIIWGDHNPVTKVSEK